MPSDPKRVQAVFLKASELPSGERDTLLDRECADDTELRRCVESLLVAHDAPDSYLDRPFVPRLSGVDESPADDPIGTRVGPYQLLQKLGEGGMGAVWVAEQREPVKRRVALKLIKPGMDSAQVLARFEQERQALALMDHDNIARILDAGMDDRGRPYFVMELVKGVSVTTYCDELNLSVRDRLGLFIPICHAVQHAHQKGIIHRDLKPANILVCIQDGRPIPKIIDFGIAKALTPNLTDASIYTAIGAVVGTVRYMSPEQAELNPLDVDTRADVYGLGVLLYELLTGTTPLDDTRLQGVAFAETLRMVREIEPPPPSVRLSEARSSEHGVRSASATPRSELRAPNFQELDWIVMKCLEKDRTRRYETVIGLARDVERYLADEPVEAGPPSVAYRVRKFVRRNRGRIIASVAVLAALLFGLIGTSAGMVWALREHSKAERRLTQVEKGAGILGSVFENIDPRAVEREGESLHAVLGRRLDHAAAQLDGDAVGDPLTVAQLQHTLGSSYLGLGYPKKAIPLFTRARHTRESLLGPRHPDTLATMNGLACAYRDVGRYKEAVTLFEETLRLRQDVLGSTDPLTFATLNNLVVAYRDVGRLKDALRAGQETEQLAVLVFGPLSEDTFMARNTLAAVYHDMGDVAAAVRLHEETLQQRRKLGVRRVGTLRSMSNLALVYLDANRPRDALALSEEALHHRQALLGSLHTETLCSMDEIAVAYRKLGRVRDAVDRSEAVLRLRRGVLGSTHPHTLLAMNHLALAYDEDDRPVEARKLFDEIYELAAEHLGRDHPDTARAACNLATAHREAREFTEAIRLYNDALAVMGEVLDADHPDTRACTGYLIGTYLRTDQPDTALPLIREYIPAERQRLGANAPRFAAVLARVGRELIDADLHAEGDELLRECLVIRTEREQDTWTTFETALTLGCSLMAQEKYPEAAALLIRGYDGLKRHESDLPPQGRALLPLAMERLVKLYEAWGKKSEREKWEAERTKYLQKQPPRK